VGPTLFEGNRMTQFERDLHQSLQRRNPPPGFAERVLARTSDIDAHGRARAFAPFTWRWAAATAMIALVIAGAAFYREHLRETAAEQSKEQLLLALQITGSRLRVVQEKLSRIEQKTIEVPLPQ
jgi:hypothetical protein